VNSGNEFIHFDSKERLKRVKKDTREKEAQIRKKKMENKKHGISSESYSYHAPTSSSPTYSREPVLEKRRFVEKSYLNESDNSCREPERVESSRPSRGLQLGKQSANKLNDFTKILKEENVVEETQGIHYFHSVHDFRNTCIVHEE
jgi:hypothetical protein